MVVVVLEERGIIECSIYGVYIVGFVCVYVCVCLRIQAGRHNGEEKYIAVHLSISLCSSS
jgi:hypothetical protein